MRTYAPWKDGESRCDSVIGLSLGLANFGCWPGISMRKSLGICFCDFRCLKIRLSQMVQVSSCRWLDPAVSQRWDEHDGGTSSTLLLPARGQQTTAFLWCGWSLSKSLGIPGPTKSSCQAKVCIPRQCSRPSCPSQRDAAPLRTSICLVENKLSPTCFSCLLLRKQGHSVTWPLGTLQAAQNISAEMFWGTFIQTSIEKQKYTTKPFLPSPLSSHSFLHPPWLSGVSLQTTSN